MYFLLMSMSHAVVSLPEYTDLVSIMVKATIRMDRENMRVRVQRQDHGVVIDHKTR